MAILWIRVIIPVVENFSSARIWKGLERLLSLGKIILYVMELNDSL